MTVIHKTCQPSYWHKFGKS